MIPTITKEWAFDAAQTNFKLEDVDATHRMVVTYAQATCSSANAVEVSLRLGFASATLPAISANSATGGLGVFMTHPGIARGGGMVVANGGAPIASGGADEDLRITLSVSTGGSTRLVVSYWIDDLS